MRCSEILVCFFLFFFLSASPGYSAKSQFELTDEDYSQEIHLLWDQEIPRILTPAEAKKIPSIKPIFLANDKEVKLTITGNKLFITSGFCDTLDELSSADLIEKLFKRKNIGIRYLKYLVQCDTKKPKSLYDYADLSPAEFDQLLRFHSRQRITKFYASLRYVLLHIAGHYIAKNNISKAYSADPEELTDMWTGRAMLRFGIPPSVAFPGIQILSYVEPSLRKSFLEDNLQPYKRMISITKISIDWLKSHKKESPSSIARLEAVTRQLEAQVKAKR